MGRLRLNFHARWKRASWKAVTGFAYFLKRAFDLVVTVAVLILFSPVFAAIALIVKLDGGPIIFRQTRFGLNGREFMMLKFQFLRRTDRVEARSPDSPPAHLPHAFSFH